MVRSYVETLQTVSNETGEPVAYTSLKRWVDRGAAKGVRLQQNIMLVLEGPQGKGEVPPCALDLSAV